MKEKIWGRDYEIKRLKYYLDSNQSEFIIVYGKYRTGKTLLLTNCFDAEYDFSFTGIYNESSKNQLYSFYSELKKKSDLKLSKPKNWFDAFGMLRKYLLSLNKETVTVFLDELSWMDTPKSDFKSALSYFWNNFIEMKIKLFISCSSEIYIINKILGDKGGLYGRSTGVIYLKRFTLRETKDYFLNFKQKTLTDEEILNIYMITGGIPYYINLFDLEIPFSVNVDNLFFGKDGILRNEFNFIFSSLFNDSVNYKKVITAIAKKSSGLTREQIVDITSVSGGMLSEILDNLCLCNFIKSYYCIGSRKKSILYQITDLFVLFNLIFIENNGNGNNENIDSDFWTKYINKAITDNWKSYAFEMVCLNNIESVKKALGINGILVNLYSWNTKAYTDKDGAMWDDGQLDIILDRADNMMNIIEVKYDPGIFVIDRDYMKKFMDKISNFKNKSKTKKGIIRTFLTVNGIKQNEYSYIADKNLTLTDLFN